MLRKQVPVRFVFEDDLSVAFLDRRPLFPGHCLLLPRAHHETLSELPADLLPRLFANVQLIVRAVEEALDCDGTFVAINNRVSQSVPHLHVHIVPRRYKDGLRGFFWPRHPYKDEDSAAEVQDRLHRVISRLRGEHRI